MVRATGWWSATGPDQQTINGNDMNDSIRFILNGEDISLSSLRPTETLLDFLRLNRHLTGTKEGCAEGDCGACTVLVGRLIDGGLHYEVRQCLHPFLSARWHATHVVTVEHLAAEDGTLHPVQQAMVDCHGSQCGFCTPGFVMSLYGLWLTTEQPSRAQIEKSLQGNLCRCTGYEPIVKAAEQVSQMRPSALFDPLEKTRADVIARLRAMQDGDTITVTCGEDRLIVPGSVAALAQVLADEPKATVVAGSTDVGLWVTKQMRKLDPVVFINHLTDLQKITSEDAGLTIGAGVTYSQAFAAMAEKIPALASLIDRIGGEQVRNMGTIGGNIANGSPIGDIAAATDRTRRDGHAALRYWRPHVAAGRLLHRLRQAGSQSRRIRRKRLRALPRRRHPVRGLQDLQTP